MMRRTTLKADDDDLATLEAEARRRGVSMAELLREMVAEGADRIRASRRPRFGVARSREGAAKAAAEDESAPVRDRSGT